MHRIALGVAVLALIGPALNVTAAEQSRAVIKQGGPGWKYSEAFPKNAPKADRNGNEWHSAAYDDSAWKTGNAPFGYGFGKSTKESEEVKKRNGAELTNNKGSYFFRKEFTVGDIAMAQHYMKLFVASDNAAIVYLNGHVLDRDSFFGRRGGHEFRYWNRKVELPSKALRQGKNILAVHLYNDPTSTDAYLDLELLLVKGPKARLFSPKGEPLFVFVQLTDTHISPSGIHQGTKQKVTEHTRTAVAEINKLKPDFVIITGDLVEEGLEAEYKVFNSVIREMKVKWYAIPGNHETLKGTWADFKKALNRPLYTSFKHKGCQFILLNGSKDEKKYYSAGFIDDDQMKWLEKELQDGKDSLCSFVLCHWPLEAKWGGGGIQNPARDRIFSLLEKHRIAAYLFGHRHNHDYSYEKGTSHVLCAGAGWNFGARPVGYRIYTVYKEVTVCTWKPLGQGIDKSMTYYIPNPRVIGNKD